MLPVFRSHWLSRRLQPFRKWLVMIDSANKSSNDLRRQPFCPADSIRFVSLATAACMISLAVVAVGHAEDELPRTRDATASIVRLAPRILVSNPLPSDGAVEDEISDESQSRWVRENLLSEVSFESLVVDSGTPQIEKYDSLPQPVVDETVEVEVEVPSLVKPVPLPKQDNFESDTSGFELMESEVLDLGEISSVPRSQYAATKPVRSPVDIRPRNLAQSGGAIVDAADLPQDTSGLLPQDPIPHLVSFHRADVDMRDLWPSASFCHRPLYFEDQRLERYGVIAGPLHRFPSVHSGLHFAWKAGMLPVSMTIDPPWKCMQSGCTPPPLKRLFR